MREKKKLWDHAYQHSGQIFRFKRALRGCHNASGGIRWDAVKAGIEQTPVRTPRRFESVANSKGIPVIVDYAHTPDALEKVVKELCARVSLRAEL